MTGVLAFLIVVALIVALTAGFSWLWWSLWCWALPQVWADGPANLIHPSWLLFFVCTVLLGMLGRTLFPSTKG